MKTGARSKLGDDAVSMPARAAGAPASAAPPVDDARLAYVGIFGEELQREAEMETLAIHLAEKVSLRKSAETSLATPPAIMGPKEVAYHLGGDEPLSPEALYQLVSRHRVPGVMTGMGRNLRFHRERFFEGLKKRVR